MSRKHATITLTVAKDGKSKIISVTDHSQYGTSVDGDKLEKEVPRIIAPGSKVTFGSGTGYIKFKYTKLAFCLSGFAAADKASLLEEIREIGALC